MRLSRSYKIALVLCLSTVALCLSSQEGEDKTASGDAQESSGSFFWPSESPVVSASFGGDGDGDFVAGVILSGEGQNALCAQDGEVVFRREEGSAHDTLPSGLGSWIALEHQKPDEGYVTVYAHLSPGSLNTQNKLKRGDIAGVYGSSGWSLGNNCYFLIFDRASNQFVNPSILLPNLKDSEPPIIRDIELVDEKGQAFDPLSVKNYKQGSYTIRGRAFDQSNAEWTLNDIALSRISVVLDGKEQFGIVLDALKVNPDSGRRVLPYPKGKNYEDFYHMGSAAYLGKVELIRGKSLLVIKVVDARGNQKSASFSLQVY